jgi:3-hydroxybutyryl-CoA dehydrogenase
MTKSLSITVIGAGLMGHGIAYVMASAGHMVRIQDPISAAIAALPEKLNAIAALFGHGEDAVRRISGFADIAEAASGTDFVIEAAPEKLEIKQAIIAELESVIAPTTIIASNTSALPITQIAAKAKRPERVVGAHFWNPPHLVKIVEIVQAAKTSDATIAIAMDTMRGVGHHPVHVRKDIPGFIGNRLQHALKHEAISLVAAGVCDAETVDDVVKFGFGQRMAVLGPLEQSDLVGLNLTKAIHDTLIPALDHSSTTQPYLDECIARGHTGMAVGQGFRRWTPEQAAAVRSRLNTFLVGQARKT